MGFDPEKITFFAKTDARGSQIPFGIKAQDRQRHMYVVGKTGMGKSTLLENMAAQDIQNGEGMAFIDPHGSAAEVLLDYVPEHRINDVIYFAPFDLANPISFNVMEDVGPDKRHLVVSGLMSTFKKIWVDAWSARMEYILTNALLALIEYPDTTLLSVNRLFSDKVYRKRVVDYIKDPAVKAFWTEEFANYTDRFAAEALPAIQNKIGQFTGNPLIRNIIGQPHSSFDIRKIMDEKKILIMNLSKGLVGETNANLLGSMLTTRIYLAAMSRADLPIEQMKTMPNFYFYVDEFQSFANATFANILSEARKYHLNLIIAHQYIEQMEEDVRNAVFGNVGTTITFRVGPFDAELLETVFSPRFLATDLVNLGFAQIYLTLMIDGIGSQPFSAVTLPPLTKPPISCKQMVIAASRNNYTRNREEVEKVVADLHSPVKEDTSPSIKKKVNHEEEQKSKFKKPEEAEIPVIKKNLEPTLVPKDKPTFPPREKVNGYEQKTSKQPRSADELRTLLAKLVKENEQKTPEANTLTPQKVNNSDAVMTNNGSGGKSKNTEALADVLKKVTQSEDKTIITTREESQTQPKDNNKDVINEGLKRQEKERLELERLAAEAEDVFTRLEGKGDVKADDPLSPKKIEKLFKPVDTERSPFAS
jgi:energy-coupling factor transporter ATP-binding protein EcfA2